MLGVFVALFCGLAFAVYLVVGGPEQIARVGRESGGVSQPVESPKEPSRAAPESVGVSYGIGDTVTVGYWTYVCRGGRWTPAILTYGEQFQRADSAFLIIYLNAKNNDNSASTLPPVHLVDDQGREFDESSESIYLQSSFGLLKKLNPGVQSNGTLLFDAPAGHYRLKLSGGFESGRYALVDLAEQPEAAAPVSRSPTNSVPKATEQPVTTVASNRPSKIIYSPAAEYTEQARKARLSGTCTLSFTVSQDGKASDITVVHSLGMGLDENAVEALKTWRFEPAFRDGKPVAEQVTVNIDFRLY